mmetsp:Transcript_8984/g.16946  ORF Transcript_8984/g.16946 Transcript_8984/m.16946 type:complete len:684 (+) Transcript_8984:192-2243(+)
MLTLSSSRTVVIGNIVTKRSRVNPNSWTVSCSLFHTYDDTYLHQRPSSGQMYRCDSFAPLTAVLPAQRNLSSYRESSRQYHSSQMVESYYKGDVMIPSSIFPTVVTVGGSKSSRPHHIFINKYCPDGDKGDAYQRAALLLPRLFSTSANDPDKKRSDRTKKLRENKPQIREEELVDVDFSNYLTGKVMDDGVPQLSAATPPLVEELQSDLSKSESNIYNFSKNDSTAESSSSSSSTTTTTITKATQDQSNLQSTDDEWFNSLLHKSKDLGRLHPEVNETYKNIEMKNVRDIQRSREQQIITVRRALGGNFVIAISKLAAFLHSGSSAMLSEFVHSIVDCGNQSLLLIGLRDSGNEADRSHPYGYGKSIYFWALVSALGTFFLGAGVSMTQAIPQLIQGGSLHEITWHVWAVLGFSFVVDGYVLTKTLGEVNRDRPPGVSLWKQVWTLRDPATLAILLEDGAACLGVVMAIGGIAATQAFNTPIYDALAGVGISTLLATMGIILVRVNHRFLLGQSVDKETRLGIEKILLNRRSIDNVNSVQSQWTGPETFSYKAEVDFDGTFLAATLMPRYQQEFAQARDTLDQDLRVLLSWYAEDVMRTVEREVRSIEAEIRRQYPGAQYIELEPMSKDADRFAIDDGLEASLKRIEIEALNRYLRSLYQPSEKITNRTNKGPPENEDISNK